MTSFSEWLEQNPDEDVSTQTTQLVPLLPAPTVAESDPNCLMCLMEFVESFGPDNLPIVEGGFGLCFEHQEKLDKLPEAELELMGPILRVARVRYELVQRGGW